MLSTAVIHRRIRRVIVTSLIRLHPVVRDHRWFEAAAAPDGYRIAAVTSRPSLPGDAAHRSTRSAWSCGHSQLTITVPGCHGWWRGHPSGSRASPGVACSSA
jgi:hypothetical protein